MEHLTGFIGRKAILYADHFLNLAGFFYRMLVMIFKSPREGRAVVKRVIIEQIYFTGVQALPIVIPAALLIGSSLIVVFSKLSGQYDIGKMITILIIRELGPLSAATIVILRSATAVAVEMSYMNVFNEIDAIEMTGIDPMRILGIPRIIGITSAIFCLFIIFDLVAIMGGYSVVLFLMRAPVGNLLEQVGKAITGGDIAVGFIKALLFGMAMTVICIYKGFREEKQLTAIPQVVSATAVQCFFFCLLMNILVSAIFYL